MNTEFKRGLRWLVMATALLMGTQAANAQDSNARGIVVDSNGKIFQANYLCASNPLCPGQLVSLTSLRVKQGSAVAIGAITPAQPANYAFIANGGNRGEIVLLVEPSPDTTPWDDHSFDSGDGATAMVVTRNVGTLFVARDGGTVEAYPRDGMGVQGYDTNLAGENQGFEYSFPVPFGGGNCSNIVGLEEWPKNSGDLLVVCDAPSGVVAVDIPDDGVSAPDLLDFSVIAAPNSLGSSLAAGGVSTVTVGPGLVKDFALIVAKPKEVLAIELSDPTHPVQRNVFTGSGQVRDLATGLCFRDAGNDDDVDTDVDETCFSTAMAGNTGNTEFVSLTFESGQLMTNVVDTITNGMKNGYGVDLINTGTVNRDACLTAEGCQIANHTAVDALEGVPPGEVIAYETQGSFTDLRYNPITLICDRNADGSPILPDGGRVELPLDFTGIPILKEASIGPEFCARNGTFFVDVISAPGITPTSGFTQYETPGECWMPGDGANSMGPGTSHTLDIVEYGLLFGDQFDLLRKDVTDPDAPIDPDTETYEADYVTNQYAQDNLVSCASRIRAGGRYTFIIEDFVGNGLGLFDLMGINDPIGNGPDENVLFDYGHREAIQRIEIPVLSPQSGCFEELLAGGALTGACEDHVVALNGGLAGWDLQKLVGNSQVVTSTGDLAGISGSEATVPLALDGLNLNIAASVDDTFAFKTIGYEGASVLGLAAVTGGEIDIGQSLTFTVSTTPRPADLVLDDGMDPNLPVKVDVPFRVPQITPALQFDGPEYGDVQEAIRMTATLTDGVWEATLVNLFEENGEEDVFYWNLESLEGRPLPTDPAIVTEIDVLSGDDSSSESAVIRVDNPFGDVAILSLEITAVAGDCGNGACNNQSDASLFDIGIEAVDRVQALSFAYEKYLRADCSSSSRPDFGMGAPGEGTRPNICTNDVSDLVPFDSAAFNEINGGIVERNIAGYQQADIEGVLLFIAHNMCELDFGTDIDPGEIGFTGLDSFCTVAPEWAVVPPAP